MPMTQASRGVRPDPVRFPLPVDSRSLALTGLWLLALLYTLYFARAFLIPLTFAILLSLLLSPPVRAFKRMHVPESIGAALVVVPLILAISAGVYQLATPAADWLSRGPESLHRIESRLRRLRKPVDQVTRTAEQMEQMVTPQAPAVQLEGDGLGAIVFGGTRAFLADAIVVTLLLYFMLASGGLFLRKVIKLLPRLQDKKRAVEIARETEVQVSMYLFVTTLINAGFGIAVGLAMWLLGMPNPVLWGVIAGLLNYIPYLGGVATTGVLGLAALLQFDDVGRALMVPAVFVLLNFVEGNVVKPIAMSRQLTLNPVVVFVSVLFWGWLWGTVGAFLAVPIVATLKITCDRIEGLSPIGEFLGT
jgi:predicted PurR-regulated permease PerM